MTDQQMNDRAWDLYRQIYAQRAVLKSYEDALGFVRVRQMEATDSVETIARRLWGISQHMRQQGDQGCASWIDVV